MVHGITPAAVKARAALFKAPSKAGWKVDGSGKSVEGP